MRKYLKILKKDKFFTICTGILILILMLTILSYFYPVDPNEINLENKLQSPSLNHIFGTDELGRDYFSRALYGGRVSISVGTISMIISVVIGTLVGVISGYIGGKVDNIIMRVLDILLSIPSFLVLIVMNSYFQPSIFTIVIIIGLLSWMEVARLVRGETMNIKENDYCLAAKALGIKPINIIIRHILINLKSIIIVSSSINVASAILTESALSFLGLGIQMPLASWGNMLQSAQKHIFDSGYLAVFPGILIFLTVMSLNVIGDKFNNSY